MWAEPPHHREQHASDDDSDGDIVCGDDDASFKKYRLLYRHRCHRVYMREGVRAELYKVLDGDEVAISIYHSIVYPAIAAPYAFCDHASKSFVRQYQYLRRWYPELCNRSQPIHTLIMAQHTRLGASAAIRVLPRELYVRVHEFSRTISHNHLLRAMAFAANIAFQWHSD